MVIRNNLLYKISSGGLIKSVLPAGFAETQWLPGGKVANNDLVRCPKVSNNNLYAASAVAAPLSVEVGLLTENETIPVSIFLRTFQARLIKPNTLSNLRVLPSMNQRASTSYLLQYNIF